MAQSQHSKQTTEIRARENSVMPPLVRDRIKKIKEYNFKNPDKFSKDHLRVIGNIHEHYCRQVNMALNAALRMPTELSVANVQQLTYGDYVQSMPEDLLTGVLNMYPFTTQFCIGIERHLMGAMLDRLLGGLGASNIREELTDVEMGVIRDTMKRMLTYLPESWQSVIPAVDDIELVALETTPITAQIVPPTDIVALVTINVEIGSYLGLITVCIPYAALEEVIESLSRQNSYKNEKLSNEDTKTFIVNKLANTDLPLKIVLGRGELKLSEVVNMQKGDIIKLETKLDERAEVWIKDELKFVGRPGQIGNHYSIAISSEFIED